MGPVEPKVPFKKKDSSSGTHHPETKLPLPNSRINERQHTRARSRLHRFFLLKNLNYRQWLFVVAVFCLLLVAIQFLLLGYVVEKQGDSVGVVEVASRGSIYSNDIDGLPHLGEDLRFEHKGVLAEFQKEAQAINLSYRSNTPVRYGHRMPRLALVFADLEVDRYQVLMATVASALRELGYLIEVFSNKDGPARTVWQRKGVPCTIIESKAPDKHAVDWLNYDGILINSLEAVDVISCLMQEPFTSVALIWTIHEKTLAPRLAHYTSTEKTEILNDWRKRFNRATVVVFQDLASSMMYSTFDSGNYFVIPAPTEECVSGLLLTQSEENLRAKFALKDDDFIVSIVGTKFSYKEFWFEHSLILQALTPLLAEFPSENNSTSQLKIFISNGDGIFMYARVIEAVSAGLGYPKDAVKHVADGASAEDILKASNLVIYGSLLEEHIFPEVLIKAMCFRKLIVAPNLSMIKKFVNDRVNGYLFPKDDSKVLTNIVLEVISNRKLSSSALEVASMGKETAKDLMASESIERYASILQSVLQLPSEVAYPKPVQEISLKRKKKWDWGIFSLVPGATFKNRTASSLTFMKKNEQPTRTKVDDTSGVDAPDEVFPYKMWEQEKEIQAALARKNKEKEELKDRSDQSRGTWEEIYRIARRAEKIKIELYERDDGELVRTGQPLTIYEPYFGEGSWPFLHVTSLYRGICLSTRGRRPGADDIDSPSRLSILSDTYYRDILGEFGAFFAMANRIDRIHKNAWIGFHSWRTSARNASLSRTAEHALLNAIEMQRNGDALYFWVRMDLDLRNPMGLDFWLFCDSINAGNCRLAFSDAFKRMYGIKKNWNTLPPMPVNGGTWSVMHSWALPTRSFLEFVMFARMFVDAMHAQMYDDHHKSGYCSLSLSRDKHCYSRVLELLVNVWAYHSARRMIYINPETGLMEEQHPLQSRRGKMWVKWFTFDVLKGMDEDLAEEADSDRPKNRWLWPSTGEVYWQGVSVKEKTKRQEEKAKRKQKSREKLQRMRKRMKQKAIGKYVKPPPEKEMKNAPNSTVSS